MSLQQQNHSAAVHMLAESMHPNNNNNNYPSMEVDINSKATGTDDVKLAALVDVDPDFKRVSQNKKVQHFLDDLQTIHITETIKIGPTLMFYLLVVVFLLPSIWAVISTLITEFPKKLFFDGCEIRGGVNATRNIDMLDCIECCNNRTFIFTDLIPLTDSAKIGQIVTIAFAVVVALLSCFSYSRLSLGEHLAVHCLSFGIVVRTKASCSQLFTVILFAFLFAGIAGLYLWVQSELTKSFNDSILGFGDKCDPKSRYAGQVLYAIFFSADINPSLAAGSLPSTPLDYVKGFAVVFTPFLPLILKLYQAANTTFSRLGLEHLVMDSNNSKEVLNLLKWEVDEADLLDAIEKYADLCRSEETIGRIIRRLIVCDMKTKRPIPSYFSMSWGTGDIDMQRVLTFLQQDRKLDLYRPYLDVTKKTPTTKTAPISINTNMTNDESDNLLGTPSSTIPASSPMKVTAKVVGTPQSGKKDDDLDSLLSPSPTAKTVEQPPPPPPPAPIPKEEFDDDFL